MARLNLFLTIATLWLTCLNVAPAFAVAKQTCVSAKCHNDMQKNANVHPKNKSCQFCHKAITTPHPEVGTKTFSSSGTACLKCHETVTDFDYLHAPVAAGDCPACHNPHTSKKNFFLKYKEQKLCNTCHDPVISKKDTMIHGKSKEIQCTSCHTQHGSSYPNLLVSEYSSAYFNNYNDKTYALCFRCHKLDLLLYPKTSYNTNFRDGKRNLHYLHVNRPTRSIACKMCHKTHASVQPMLMADKVSFGNWQMPIGFIATKNGGSCTPGCHKAKTYDRTIRRKSRGG